MVTDMGIIRDNVRRGDVVSSKRILLTALIKGNDEIRHQILSELDVEHFQLPALDLIFDAIQQSLRSRGQVDKDFLYQSMEEYVRTEVVASWIEFIDRILASGLPDDETLDRAFSCLQKAYANQDLEPGESFPESEKHVVVALIKGDRQTQQRVLEEVSVDHFDASIDSIFQWASELLRTEGKVDKEALYRKSNEYVVNEVMRGYIAPIDHVLALDMPDPEMIDKAIANLKKAHARMSTWRSERNGI